MTDSAKPMTGLADWLRSVASSAATSEPHANTLRTWAAEVEAARAAPEVKTGLQQHVKELAEHHGSIRAAARVLMVDHAYLYRLSVGEKDDPGDDLLRKLKLRRVVSYEPISEGKHG